METEDASIHPEDEIDSPLLAPSDLKSQATSPKMAPEVFNFNDKIKTEDSIIANNRGGMEAKVEKMDAKLPQDPISTPSSNNYAERVTNKTPKGKDKGRNMYAHAKSRVESMWNDSRQDIINSDDTPLSM